MTQTKARAGGILRVSLDNTWRTPESILERVRAYFGGVIPFDPATGPENPTRAHRFCAGAPGTLFAGEGLASKNGLEVAWEWPTFVNPPYGEELRAWLAKIVHEAEHGAEVVALLPTTRWETPYLQRSLLAATAVCFHRGRVAFVSSLDGVAVPGNSSGSMLLGFHVDPARFREAFAPLGACLVLAPLGEPQTRRERQ